jgi:LPXTG-motif cell wall-anchored protein
MVRKLFVCASTVALLTWCAGIASAQYAIADREARFTFARGFALPDTTLPAGRYLFRVADSNATGNFVQVYSADRAVLHGTYMAVPSERHGTPERSQVHLVTIPSKGVPAVESWSDPSVGSRLEFVYPSAEASEIARATGRTDDTVGDRAAVSDSASARVEAPVETIADASVAQQSSSPAAAQEPAPAPQPPADAPAAMTGPSELPQTATPMPLVTLVGLISMSAGVGLWWLRRRRAGSPRSSWYEVRAGHRR